MSQSVVYPPLRSLLFVPGNNPTMIAKSWTRGADGIIFDLEDAVPEHAKAEARQNVRAKLEAAPGGSAFPLVRINSSSTPYWRDDVKAILNARLKGILLPKCESPREVASVVELLAEEEKSRGLATGSVGLFLLVESARGLLQASQLAETSSRVAGLVFGAEDYCRDMGVERTSEGDELLYARSFLAICARAHDCLAIDTVYSDFNDAEGLRRETAVGKQLGFSGKLAIHPKQVEIIHEVFCPSKQEVAEARKVLQAFHEASAKGVAVASLEGKMIDKPIVERARRIIALAESRSRR